MALTAPVVVSALYTAGLFILPLVGNVGGMVWAYIARGTATAWERSVLTYQIRTFWIAVLYGVIVTVLSVVTFGIGYILLLPLVVWYIIRLVKMWMASTQQAPIASETSWLW